MLRLSPGDGRGLEETKDVKVVCVPSSITLSSWKVTDKDDKDKVLQSAFSVW